MGSLNMPRSCDGVAGIIPSELGDLAALQELDLSDNKLTGIDRLLAGMNCRYCTGLVILMVLSVIGRCFRFCSVIVGHVAPTTSYLELYLKY